MPFLSENSKRDYGELCCILFKNPVRSPDIFLQTGFILTILFKLKNSLLFLLQRIFTEYFILGSSPDLILSKYSPFELLQSPTPPARWGI